MVFFLVLCVVFFFKQKTAYEMRISDWTSDVCSSDLAEYPRGDAVLVPRMADADAQAVELAVAEQAHGVAQAVLATVAAVELQPRHAGWQVEFVVQIGRASCRERVCQYV